MVKKDVLYAGFAYLANCAEVAQAFKYTHEAIGTGDCQLKPRIDEEYGSAIDSVANDRVNFVKGLGDLENQHELSMVFALDRENVWTTAMRGGYSLSYDLSAQLMIVDFAEKKVIAAFPVHIRYFDFADHRPSHNHHVSVIEELLLKQEFPVNLLS